MDTMRDVNLRRIDLNLLVVFDAVAATRSVTAAADRLALSQPAVSHALGRLRHALGDTLFVRGRKGLTLTPRAADLVGPVREVLDAIGRAVAPPRFNPGETQQTFRLGATEYAALTVVPALARALHAAAPQALFELQHLDERMVERLESGALDLVFWATDPPAPPLVTAELFRETHIGVVDPRHPLAGRAQRGAVTLDDYLAFPHVRMSYGLATPNPVDDALGALRRERRVAVVTASFQSALASLVGTNLIATVPARVVSCFEPVMPLLRFQLPLTLSDYPYYALWHRRTDADPALQWLRGVIFDLNAAMPAP